MSGVVAAPGRDAGGESVLGVWAPGRCDRARRSPAREEAHLLRCAEEADESTATATGVLSADDLAEADQLGDVELTSEEEYAEALDAEIRWDLEPDGTLARGPRTP